MNNFLILLRCRLPLQMRSHIRALNAQYREKDAVTDVLSFPLLEDLNEAAQNLRRVQMELSRSRWEILCCAWSVLPNRQKHLAILWDRELAFLAVHSTLHLLGYDHELGEAEDKDMRRRQREILHQMGLDRVDTQA